MGVIKSASDVFDEIKYPLHKGTIFTIPISASLQTILSVYGRGRLFTAITQTFNTIITELKITIDGNVEFWQMPTGTSTGYLYGIEQAQNLLYNSSIGVVNPTYSTVRTNPTAVYPNSSQVTAPSVAALPTSIPFNSSLLIEARVNTGGSASSMDITYNA